MKYKGRKKLVGGGAMKAITGGMQANQAFVTTLNTVGSDLIGDVSPEQQIKMDNMNKYGAFGAAGMALAALTASKDLKAYEAEKAEAQRLTNLDYSERARAGYQDGGTLTHYEGLPHELGGIPIGQEHEVEHGETSYPAADGQRVFSDTLKDGKRTFAQHSKKIEKEADMRPTDKVAQTIKERRLDKLFARQEAQKIMKEDMMSTKAGAKAYGIMKKGGRIKHEGGEIIDLPDYVPEAPYVNPALLGRPDLASAYQIAQGLEPVLDTSWKPSTGRIPQYIQRGEAPEGYTAPHSLPVQAANITGQTIQDPNAPFSDFAMFGEAPQIGASENPVENATGISKEDIRKMIGIDEGYATMGQLSQLMGPVSQFAITAADKDKMKFKRMDNVQLDRTTAPTIYKTQLREQSAAARQAIRRSTGNISQYLGSMLALGKRDVEGAKGAALIRANLDNKQAAMDFQREASNTDIVNKERVYNQSLRNMRRANYIKSLEGAGTRTAGMVKDDLKYETDLTMEALKLGALDGMYHNIEKVENPDGTISFRVARR